MYNRRLSCTCGLQISDHRKYTPRLHRQPEFTRLVLQDCLLFVRNGAGVSHVYQRGDDLMYVTVDPLT